MKKIVLIDSHAIIHRAFHALPPLTANGGEPVNAVYGFASILLRILKELQPDYLAAAFDMPGKTFRHEQYAEYKAHRPPAPEELKSQFAKVHELVEAFGIPVFQKEGYEADDIIGTMTRELSDEEDCEVIIITGDSDALQLVRPNVKVYTMKQGVNDIAEYGEEEVRRRYGLEPEQLIDFKGLKGDVSDNIKGVKGIGEKTATDLLQKFGSIDGIYGALEKGKAEISETVAAKLREGKEDALFSRELARIDQHVPIEVKPEDVMWHDGSHEAAAAEIFRKYGFLSLIKRLPGFAGTVGAEKDAGKKGKRKTKETVAAQPSLLDLPDQAGVAGVVQEKKEIPMIRSAKGFSAYLKGGGQRNHIGLLLIDGRICIIDEPTTKKRFNKHSNILENVRMFLLDDITLQCRDAKKFFEAGGFACHDAKSIIRFLGAQGIKAGEIEFDSMLAAYLVDSSAGNFSWDAVASRELGWPVQANVADDLRYFFEVVVSLQAKLAAANAERMFRDIELPLAPVLADMEDCGILLDQKLLAQIGKKLDRELKKLTEDIYALAGSEFNINSSQQLSHVLFSTLGIGTQGLRKTAKGGVISTRESELEKLKSENPIIEKVLGYRELAKLKNTYVDALPELVDPADGRLHTTFNQTGASTGRLSSSNPNLQNIPILSEYGREVRKAFVADKDFLLVSFDYSQIELRVAAHMAHDEKMIEAFRNGADIHTITAAAVYHVAPEAVTPELRRAAKTLNFGVLYGMGQNAFAEATGFSRPDAKRFIDEYFRDFSGIAAFIENTKEFAREHGYVETIFGRRRYIPEIFSPNFQLRREAERMAVNMPVQGSATGDIIKLAMVKVREWVDREKFGQYVRMLLQVHDELVFEIAESRAEKLIPQIKHIMESVADLEVPLVVDAKAGYNWGEQKKYF
ncbi:MAG: DNA polymerase I [Candidatus Sungbacteria bacterium]|nr:DNA polymerase I [Candidatus Sungbacteria bacterium]